MATLVSRFIDETSLGNCSFFRFEDVFENFVGFSNLALLKNKIVGSLRIRNIVFETYNSRRFFLRASLLASRSASKSAIGMKSSIQVVETLRTNTTEILINRASRLDRCFWLGSWCA